MKNVVGSILASICLAFSQCSMADTYIGSWNLMRLGSNNGKDMSAVAQVARNADFLAVQEVMNEKGLVALERALEKETGESWSTLASSPVGRGNYHELYAFVWKDSKVEYEDGAVLYLDKGDTFSREPFSARFKIKESGKTFAASTAHILYGKSESDREPEILALGRYWDWLKEVYPGEKTVFLMGDFNMPFTKPAFADLKLRAIPLIRKGKSTLGERDGKYSNLYDQIWLDKDSPLTVSKAGVFQYPRLLGLTHTQSRKGVSDHAPVMAVVN